MAYYETKCEISDEDASWKNWLDEVQNGRLFGHYSFSHGRYLVNRARRLDHYYKTKCEFLGEDAPWKVLTYEFKMADNQHYLPW